ncbi:UDP-glucose sterol transferase [Penicillium daleae]|uniref:UDP-glucose sterol transferase n=1 Tax=Penicillium daleae TaxID=63821 RepID=A0AAD6BZY2_9EURO|nr:UDP-glucose sterol transferase [Penicillium daleae]KAJ5440103.1 UDP-glucose sterol transferase [Penicillium daleae]
MTPDTNYQPPQELQDFLDAGELPIYIGFGSIVVNDPLKLTTIIFEARAIISKGWSNISVSDAETPSNIFLLDKCPHDWLFLRVSCVIHHGGAGTTAAGVLVGCPTPVPYNQLTTAKLASAIKTALKASTKRYAEDIGKKMRIETGV